jgi:raffinose/stachyose/melibiose transport system permease protein
MNRKKLYPWYFASGAAVLFFLLCFLPGIIGIAYSFTDWNNFTNDIRFVGLDNYKRIFEGNSEYLLYIKNTLVIPDPCGAGTRKYMDGVSALWYNGV